ncbi:MAG: hypothetical protein BJ554DRAFT_4213 [Olpidium bornovanus]|uniref:Uncharacterized protein n=1 Tax=Olpidium bornovanus TaxID=278681 RepID=A0A8H8DL80_9FUNG|nr:MAG: hypothetical protein BJ554DRAFT_4213 [Olpidium bornovanus]
MEGRELAGESMTPPYTPPGVRHMRSTTASTTSRRSRTVKDSVKALRERYRREETEQRHQEELKDLCQRLAREKAHQA